MRRSGGLVALAVAVVLGLPALRATGLSGPAALAAAVPAVDIANSARAGPTRDVATDSVCDTDYRHDSALGAIYDRHKHVGHWTRRAVRVTALADRTGYDRGDQYAGVSWVTNTRSISWTKQGLRNWRLPLETGYLDATSDLEFTGDPPGRPLIAGQCDLPVRNPLLPRQATMALIGSGAVGLAGLWQRRRIARRG